MAAKAKAAELEAQNDEFVTFEWNGDTYRVRKKFRRLRFLRKLNSDPVEALSEAIPGEDIERIEDQEIDNSDLENLFNAISEALTGSPKG